MVGGKTPGDAPIGILLYENAGERLIGDPGFPGSFPFPVLYQAVKGSYRDLITGSDKARSRLCSAAGELAEKGVCAIAGDCGLMALYQKEIADCTGIPVISSSLVLLPFLCRITAHDTQIGILTGHSELLAYSHLMAAGAGQLKNLCIQGMQDEPHFRQTVIEGTGHHEYGLMKEDVLHATKKLIAKGTKVRTILLECSNLTTYGHDITKEFGLPVFDINTAIYFLHTALIKPDHFTAT